MDELVNLEKIVKIMQKAGVVFEKGLSAKEVVLAEKKFGFKFPEDLKQFLRFALPVAKIDNQSLPSFPNWRSLKGDYFKIYMDLPGNGILFDVVRNGFWLDSFGPKPKSVMTAKKIIKKIINSSPQLIPIYKNRYISATPKSSGNPVLSVHQTDIIYYGTNLHDYLMVEFGGKKHISERKMTLQNKNEIKNIRRIKFWSEVVDKNYKK